MNICLTILSLASLIFPALDAIAVRESEFLPLPQMVTAGAAAEENAAPPMFVLQIGISNYVHYAHLSGVADVLKMRELLMGDAYKVPRENIITLCDDGSFKSADGAIVKCDGAATKKSIVESFEKHLIANAENYYKKTGKQAVVVFEFSGHGSQAPDTNGDERDDHLDETLVTWDSEDAPGKNFDISDDEIYELTKRLSPFTDNIVYIMDSCHSGSGTRGSEDSRSVPARKNPVVALEDKTSNTRGTANVIEKKTEADEGQTDLLPPSKNYIVISAAQAGQRAGQKTFFPDKTAKTPLTYGYLTFYLMEELRNATATTSYRDVMENVRRKVSAEKPSQTPQIEGNDNRIVFKGLSKVKDAGIKISDASGNRITVEAGLMQGVTTGTILDIYSVADEKIAVAKVVDAVADKAVAEIVNVKTTDGVIISPKRAVSAADKDRAILVSPDLGAARIKFLPDGDDAKLNDADKQIIERLREKFSVKDGGAGVRGVDLATGKWNDARADWDVALLKDRFDKVFPDKTRAALTEDEAKTTREKTVYKDFPAADKEVFYLAGKDFVPLYGFYAEAGNAKETAAFIEQVVAQIARLRSVKAIANDKSRLNKKTIVGGESRTASPIVIKPFRFDFNPDDACDAGGNVKTPGKEYVKLDAASRTYKFDLEQVFGLEIYNTSDAPLYITVLDIGTDGGVSIVLPQQIGDEKENGVLLAAKTGKVVFPYKCDDEIKETFYPSGIETFKVIASTTPTNRASFEFLEMDPLIGLRGEEGNSPLKTLADWTTAEVDFQISSTRRKPQ